MYDTSNLNMQHLGAWHMFFFVMTLKHPTFFSSQYLLNSHVTNIKYVLCHFVVYRIRSHNVFHSVCKYTLESIIIRVTKIYITLDIVVLKIFSMVRVNSVFT